MIRQVECLDRQTSQASGNSSLLNWSSPVPYFGRLSDSRVATVGLNPSVSEFLDRQGNELDGEARRLPTLHSLGLSDWGSADYSHISEMLIACEHYFAVNPYGRWFDVLDRVLQPSGYSYYSLESPAVHLDLVPFATDPKWNALTSAERAGLLASGSRFLADSIAASAVDLVILNGRSVVIHFESMLDSHSLVANPMSAWDLPRPDGRSVPGIAFEGVIDRLGGVDIGRQVRVLGFNHNLQSSFGVSARVVREIGKWISASSRRVLS